MTNEVLNVRDITNSVRWVAYSFSQSTNRIFYGNTIQFVNLGTGSVLINDIYELRSGASQSLECLKNEIDETPYKITFINGFTNKLQIFVKEDKGNSILLERRLIKARKPAPNRREQIKELNLKNAIKFLVPRKIDINKIDISF